MGKVYIRTQDREKLVFLGNDINCVEYRDISAQEKWHDSHAVIAGRVLGIYETRKRCLAILDEIQKVMLSDTPKVYQMPEK